MNIHFLSEHKQFIEDLVSSGQYNSPSEVIRDALFVFEEQFQLHKLRLERLRSDIQLGLDQLERGECTEYDEKSLTEFFEELKAEGVIDQLKLKESTRRLKRFTLSTLAKDDLRQIGAYIRLHNPSAADRFLDLLRDKFFLLADTPRMGRRRTEFSPRLFSFAVKKYVIFYRQRERGIEIARVLHGARDLKAIFRRVEKVD